MPGKDCCFAVKTWSLSTILHPSFFFFFKNAFLRCSWMSQPPPCCSCVGMFCTSGNGCEWEDYQTYIMRELMQSDWVRLTRVTKYYISDFYRRGWSVFSESPQLYKHCSSWKLAAFPFTQPLQSKAHTLKVIFQTNFTLEKQTNKSKTNKMPSYTNKTMLSQYNIKATSWIGNMVT